LKAPVKRQIFHRHLVSPHQTTKNQTTNSKFDKSMEVANLLQLQHASHLLLLLLPPPELALGSPSLV